MSHYKHLTPSEREKIFLLHSQKKSISFIATEIHRNKSTISRELRRNRINDEYSPSKAQDAYCSRRKACHPQHKLSDPDMYRYVQDKFIHHSWSPEQISGRLKLEDASMQISANTIYRGIYAGMFDTDDIKAVYGSRGAVKKLRHRGKRRHTKGFVETRGKIPISNDIADRPEAAENRSRIGDWEGDTVLGKDGKSCLVTLVDRSSRYLLSSKAAYKKADEVRDTMIGCLKDEPCCSITPDRGKEFAKHADVSAALDDVKFYFPLPHHPWQRGTNENTNGLLREYFPKGTDFDTISEAYVQSKVAELNMRPRKCLGFKTPYEVYHSETLHLA